MEQTHMRKLLIPLLSVLLVISVAINIAARIPAVKKPTSVVGTYYTHTVNGTYIILTKTGQYCRYRPGQILETGRYQQAEQDVYASSTEQAEDPSQNPVVLSFDNGDGDTAVVFNDIMVFLFDDGHSIQLTKIADHPYYDNVPELPKS